MYTHDENCLCFPCYGIRLRKTDKIFSTLQGFNNTIPDPMIELSSFDEILLKTVHNRLFSDYMDSLYMGLT